MLKQAIEFAEENDLHFTFNTENKYFFWYTNEITSDRINIGDTDKFEQEKIKMQKDEK